MSISSSQTSIFLARYTFQSPEAQISQDSLRFLSFLEEILNIYCFMVSSNYSVRKRAKAYLIIEFPHKSIQFLVKNEAQPHQEKFSV